jgi:flagellar hook assembly protein FlgD
LSVDLSAVTYCISSGSSSQANASTKEVSSSSQENIIESLTTFKIYPNPATSKLFVRSIEQNDVKANITLYNMNGMQVRSYNISDKYNQVHELDINGLPTGLYIIRIIGVQGNLLKTERIIIK